MTHPTTAPRKAFGEALAEIGHARSDLLVLDADVGTSTLTSLFAKAHPDRFIQMGIAEANMMGVAAGLATLGFTPFVSTFAAFLSRRCLDQFFISVAYPGLNVKLNGSYGGIPTGRAGATHQALEDLAILRAIPGVRILCPADGPETKHAVELALSTPGPVYLRTVRCEVPTFLPPDHRPRWGKALVLKEPGYDLTLISYGMMTFRALKAAEELAKEGISAGVLHMPSLKPLDAEAVTEAAGRSGRLLTVENHSTTGGLGSAVAEITAERLPCRLKRLGFPDVFGESGDDEALFARVGCDIAGIVAAARDWLRS